MDGDRIVNIDMSVLENIGRMKNGLELYNTTHRDGFKVAYQEIFPDYKLNFEKPEDRFGYLYFVSVVYFSDICRYINGIVAASKDNDEAARVLAVFRITIDEIVATLNRAVYISNEIRKINIKSGLHQDALLYVQKQSEYIQQMIPISEVILPIIKILVAAEVNIDGDDEILHSMSEFSDALTRVINTK